MLQWLGDGEEQPAAAERQVVLQGSRCGGLMMVMTDEQPAARDVMEW